MILKENDIEIDFSNAIGAKRFDDSKHRLSHCMKAVDFVVELSDKILFIEVKDPDNPNARRAGLIKFAKKYLIGELTVKCRDSYLYEDAMENLNKPVFYYVLLAWDVIDTAMLSMLSDMLKTQIPIKGPPENPWKKKFIHGCDIFNISTWRKHLSQFPISRISQ